jgi:microcystin-dependent protein
MRTKSFLIIVILAVILSVPAFAAISRTLNFQGRFIDNGSPKIGTDNITFKIYNVKDGGSALWSEPDLVSFEAGVFSVTLGTISPLNINLNQDLWVEMMITSSSTTLSPRQRLNPSIYALYAVTAETANSLAGSVAGIIPVGGILPFPSPVTPEGFLECAGQPVLKSTYPALYVALGSGSIYGETITTFNVPDYRGYFLRGRDAGAGKDPDVGSRTGLSIANQIGSTQADQYGRHNHGTNGYYLSSDSGFYQADSGTGAFPNRLQQFSGTQDNGGNETRPKNIYVMYIIRAR